MSYSLLEFVKIMLFKTMDAYSIIFIYLFVVVFTYVVALHCEPFNKSSLMLRFEDVCSVQ